MGRVGDGERIAPSAVASPLGFGSVMEMLTSAQWAAVLAVVAVAYIVRGISGFGSGLIAIPLLLMTRL